MKKLLFAAAALALVVAAPQTAQAQTDIATLRITIPQLLFINADDATWTDPTAANIDGTHSTSANVTHAGTVGYKLQVRSNQSHFDLDSSSDTGIAAGQVTVDAGGTPVSLTVGDQDVLTGQGPGITVTSVGYDLDLSGAAWLPDGLYELPITYTIVAVP